MRREQKTRFVNESFATLMDEKGSAFSVSKRLELRDLRMADIYFDLISDYEDRFGAELAEMRYVDYDTMVEEIVEKIDIEKYPELFADKHQLRLSLVRTTFLYNRWCRRNKLPAKDNITRSTQVKKMKLEYEIIRSPAHLQEMLDKALDEEKKCTADLCCRGAAWLAYAGLTEEEVVTITAKDINFRDKSLCVFRDGFPRKIRLFDEGMESLSLLAKLTAFDSYRKSYKDKKTEFKRVNSDSIIRGVDTGRSARSKISKKQRSNSIILANIFNRQRSGGKLEPLTYKNLWKCGYFYRAYLEERARGPVDSIYELDKSQLGWDNARSVKRFRLIALDEMLQEELAAALEVTDSKEAGNRERYWRNTIFKEYAAWKSVARLDFEAEP